MSGTGGAGTVTVDGVLELALRRSPGLRTTRMICVDGPAGSGKTTFADRLVAAARARGLSTELVHMDDLFEGWGGLSDAGDRVLEQVVRPLASGRPGRYARYDWLQERYADMVDVAPADLLVVEGVGSGDPRYADRMTALVWVEAPPALRLERGLARDGAGLEPHWRDWMRKEAELHARDRTALRADVLVDGSSGEVSLGRPAGA